MNADIELKKQMSTQNFKEQFFSQIYEENIEKIYRFVLFKTNSETLSQDLTAETFSKLWGQISKGVEIKNPSGFLYRVVRNLLIDHYRCKEKGAISLDDMNFVIDSKKGVEEAVSEKDDLSKVKVALASLKDPYRQIISLYYIEQESMSEVAKSVQKSEGATRVLLHRGMKKLKKHLEA
ncbi:MAG: sigma-70 family RNA polymerase sigma factor [Candidatus Pacebacteria bacterium]|nr:sigma-70 family RNA polymerase sigma factor [Candidatus Paceibacterota bacterium]